MIEKLIKENEWLIYEIAKRYSSYYSIEDLYQAGSIGIIKASKKYKSEYNVKFSTYAYKSILGEIIDFIRKDRNIVLSEETYLIYKKYLKVKELLTSDREPTFSEICSFMEISESQMLNIIESISITKSDVYDDKLLIENELSQLSEFDRSLIDYRYYLGYTQSETASLLGISQVKVSRQEKLILNRIKDNITN